MRIVSPPQINTNAGFDKTLQGQQRQNHRGVYYYIKRWSEEFDVDFALLHTKLEYSLPLLQKQLKRDLQLHDLLFIDIETTGLSPTRPLFLLGTMSSLPKPSLELFLARTPQEEEATLAAFAQLSEGKVLISFNGIFFDWPYIQKRSQQHNIVLYPPRAHFDLLPFARKNWKRHLLDCRLQTLETYYCNRKRQGDIPGRNIPNQYKQFSQTHLATGNGANHILPIIHHNYWDVLTMAELLADHCK